jgi:hypothetical protein
MKDLETQSLNGGHRDRWRGASFSSRLDQTSQTLATDRFLPADEARLWAEWAIVRSYMDGWLADRPNPKGGLK